MSTTRILCIGDTHFPFEQKNFFKDLYYLVNSYKPTHVVHMGDVVDLLTFNRFQPEPDAPDSKHEMDESMKRVNRMVKLLSKVPNVYVCNGNHDCRINKRANSVMIPSAFVRPLHEILKFPATWAIGNEHIIDDIVFMHGKSPVRGKIVGAYGMSVVQGHYHSKLSIEYIQSPVRRLWQAFTGGAIDTNSLGAAYAKNNIEVSAYGFLEITDGVPKIIPGTL